METGRTKNRKLKNSAIQKSKTRTIKNSPSQNSKI